MSQDPLRAQVREVEETIKEQFEKIKYFNMIRLELIQRLLGEENFEVLEHCLVVNQQKLQRFALLKEIEQILQPPEPQATKPTSKFRGRTYHTKD